MTNDDRTLGVTVADGSSALLHVLTAVAEARIELHDVGMQRPTLDDVFLGLTGHPSEEQAEPERAVAAR